MTILRLFARVAPPIGLVAAVAVGCSSSNADRTPFTDPDAAMFAPATCTNHTCTPDLLSYLDCNNVAVACAPGLGCQGGQCIPACDAAKAQESTIGCEYLPVVPSAAPSVLGSCYAVMIANVWNAPVTLDLSWGDQAISTSYVRVPRGSGAAISYDLLPDGKLPPGQLAVAFLSARKPAYDPSWEGTDCPAGVGAAISEEAWVSTGGRGRAFQIKSSAPIIAYDIYPYGGASTFFPSASLLLPTSAWGKNYVAVDGYAAAPAMVERGLFPFVQITAAEDATTISILPKVALGGGPNLPSAPVGATYTATLARGEYVQFSQKDELNGTIIDADKPVAVIGGNQCADVPADKTACDTLHQQLPPIQLMGHEYVATRYRDRRSDNTTNLEVVPWRIAGVVDGTTLVYDPDQPTAPKQIGRGEVVEFESPGPFVVRSQDKDHPIYVASYMTGGELAQYHYGNGGPVSGHGDPEFVNVAPLGQYLSSYLFLTDPTYGNTNLVFVRKASDAKDVTLDCLGPVTGWQKVGLGDYETARVDLMFLGQPVGNCANGAHRATSDAPFGLTVWGFDDYASYGFVAGMSAKALNTVAIPVPR